MEESLTIQKKNHTLLVTVHPDFVEAVALLSDDLYLLLSMKSNGMGVNAKAAYERNVYSDLVHRLFPEKAAFIHLFGSAQELSDYKGAHGIKVVANNGNGWFKTACFDLSSQRTKAQVMDYLGKMSDAFAKQTYILP